jgi:Ca2+-binding EF-hand superfamily protein
MKTTLLLLVAVVLWSMPAFAADPSAAQINTAFSKADTNKDGTVSRAEAMKFGITAQAFEKANPGKDGTLNKTEFVSAVRYQFEHANPDKDGTLSRKEAGTAGVKSNKTVTGANTDKDGTLDFAEYLHALTMQAK